MLIILHVTKLSEQFTVKSVWWSEKHHKGLLIHKRQQASYGPSDIRNLFQRQSDALVSTAISPIFFKTTINPIKRLRLELSSALVKFYVAMKKTISLRSGADCSSLPIQSWYLALLTKTHLASLTVEASPLFCLLYNVIELLVGDFHVMWNEERSLSTVEAMVDI